MSQQRGSGLGIPTHVPTSQHARVLRKIAARRRLRQMARRPAGITFTLTGTAKDGPVCLSPEPRILTRRELEVLRLVATGATDRRIADRLYVSQRTVSSHVSNILDKLDVPSRKVAVLAAARIGLL